MTPSTRSHAEPGPGLVDESLPWGWSFQELSRVGIEARPQEGRAEILFQRNAGGAPGLRGTQLLHRNIGLFPADLGFYRTVVPEGFHAVLFVDSTTATRPIEEPA